MERIEDKDKEKDRKEGVGIRMIKKKEVRRERGLKI